MISKNLRVLSAILVLAVLQACSQAPAGLPAGQDTAIPATAAPVPFAAESGGPPGFSASLAAPDLVLLTWETVPEAVGYDLQIVFDGLAPLTLAHLPADATRYEHFLAPESSLLTYRLQTLTSAGPAGASSLQIATGAHASNPLAVLATFSDTGAVSAVIGPAGGTLETVDARGVTYTLVIPPDAITDDLTVKMTPVSTIDGWPLDGSFAGAVRLEPDGWLLNEIASLTIRLPGALPDGLATVGFAFNGGGAEFHLTPAYTGPASIGGSGIGGDRRASPALQQDAGVIRLPVMELRTAGVGGTGADAAEALASGHAPTGSSDSADQKAAVTKVLDDLAPLLTPAEIGDIATTNLLTQILNAGDCLEFKRAVGSFQTWDSSAAQLGAGYGNYASDRQVILDQLAELAIKTIEKASDECLSADKGVVPASLPCAEKLTRELEAPSTPFFTELQSTMLATPGMSGRLSAAKAAAEKCPHSYGVNEAATLGYRWTSACIPSLDRPYQVVWIGPGLKGEYRLYPSNPFSGRMEGQAELSMPAGSTGTIVYEGKYTIDITKENIRGEPVELNAKLTYTMTTTLCSGGVCSTATDTGKHEIPLLVNNHRCPVR